MEDAIKAHTEAMEKQSAEMKTLLGATNDRLEKIEGVQQTLSKSAERGFEQSAKLFKAVSQIQRWVHHSTKTIQKTLDEIKELEEKRTTEKEMGIRAEIERRFILGAEDMRKRYIFQQSEKLETVVSAKTQHGLQTAKTVLEDFCKRLDSVEKEIPRSIEHCLADLSMLLSELLPQLPIFESPQLLTPKEHSATQADEAIARIRNGEAAVPPESYVAYVQREYTEALKAYQEELDHATEPPVNFTDEAIHRQFSDLARRLVDAFDLKAPTDNLMKQILSYYYQRTIPQLLDAFGYEELPIEIGKTTAVESLHEIIESRECEYPSGTVAEVLLKGFREKDPPHRVIRKARVIRAQ
jgi:hypothetical protein